MNTKTAEPTKTEILAEISVTFRSEVEALQQARKNANGILYAQIAKNDADFDAAYDAASLKAQAAWSAIQ